MTVVSMTTEEAEAAIKRWAKIHFRIHETDPSPEVDVFDLEYNTDEDEWTAELQVSTSEDNAYVSFWVDDKHGIQVPFVDY